MSIIRNFSYSFLLQLFNTALVFFISIFTTRILGPEGKGEYSIFVNSLSLAVIWLGFSIPSSLVYFVNVKNVSISDIFPFTIIFTLLTSIILLGAIKLVFALNVSSVIFPFRYSSEPWQYLFIFQYFVAQFNALCASFLNAKKVFVPQQWIICVTSVFSLLLWLSIYFKIIDLSLNPFPLVAIISCFLALPTLFSYLYLLRSDIKFSNLSLLTFKEIRPLIKFASLGYICSVLQFLNYRLDIWFVDYYCGKAETGIYSLSVSIAQLVWILPTTMAGIMYSYLSTASEQDRLDLARSYSKYAFWATFLCGIAVFCFFGMSIPVLYGNSFESARFLLGFLLIGIVPFSITNILGAYNAAIDKQELNLFTSGIGFIFAAIAYVTLIPTFGTAGAAIATSISYFGSTLYIIYIFNKKNPEFKIHLKLTHEDFKKIKGKISQMQAKYFTQ